MACKELKVSEEARVKAVSSAEAAARQADKLTQKLANLPKVIANRKKLHFSIVYNRSYCYHCGKAVV